MLTAIKNMNKELKNVTWPTTKEAIKYTAVTLFVVAVFMVAIFGFDTLFSFLSSLIFKR